MSLAVTFRTARVLHGLICEGVAFYKSNKALFDAAPIVLSPDDAGSFYVAHRAICEELLARVSAISLTAQQLASLARSSPSVSGHLDALEAALDEAVAMVQENTMPAGLPPLRRGVWIYQHAVGQKQAQLRASDISTRITQEVTSLQLCVSVATHELLAAHVRDVDEREEAQAIVDYCERFHITLAVKLDGLETRMAEDNCALMAAITEGNDEVLKQLILSRADSAAMTEAAAERVIAQVKAGCPAVHAQLEVINNKVQQLAVDNEAFKDEILATLRALVNPLAAKIDQLHLAHDVAVSHASLCGDEKYDDERDGEGDELQVVLDAVLRLGEQVTKQGAAASTRASSDAQFRSLDTVIKALHETTFDRTVEVLRRSTADSKQDLLELMKAVKDAVQSATTGDIQKQPGSPKTQQKRRPPGSVKSPRIAASKSVQCRGECDDGEQCRRMLRDGTTRCWQHTGQAPASSAPSKATCRGICADRSRCARKPSSTGYCWQHDEQRPGSASTSRPSGAASGSTRCEGITRLGDQCELKVTNGRYCHHHIAQRAARSGTPRAQPVSPEVSHLCGAPTHAGTPCRRYPSEGSRHCSLHQATRSTASIRLVSSSSGSGTASSSVQCIATTRQHSQCTRKATVGSLCSQHNKMREG